MTRMPRRGPCSWRATWAALPIICLAALMAGAPDSLAQPVEDPGAQRVAPSRFVLSRPVSTTPPEIRVPAWGRVVSNPGGQLDINASISGQVAEVYVLPGSKVSSGDPIATVTSPDFIFTQSSYLALLGNEEQLEILRGEGNLPNYLRDARDNLRWWGMTEAQIDRLVETGEVVDRLNLVAPEDGIITEVLVQPGDMIDAGDRTMQSFIVLGRAIARLQRAASPLTLEVWVYPDVELGPAERLVTAADPTAAREGMGPEAATPPAEQAAGSPDDAASPTAQGGNAAAGMMAGGPLMDGFNGSSAAPPPPPAADDEEVRARNAAREAERAPKGAAGGSGSETAAPDNRSSSVETRASDGSAADDAESPDAAASSAPPEEGPAFEGANAPDATTRKPVEAPVAEGADPDSVQASNGGDDGKARAVQAAPDAVKPDAVETDTAISAPPPAHVRLPRGGPGGTAITLPVSLIAPAIDETTQQARGLVSLAAVEDEFLLGQVIALEIVRTPGAGIWIPAEAVLSPDIAPTLFTDDGDNGYLRHSVRIAERAPGWFRVEELDREARVVIRGKTLLEGEFRRSAAGIEAGSHDDDHHH